MPKITAKLDRSEPLFGDDDPLEVEIPGVGVVRLSDHEVNPPYEDDVSPERTPLVYLVEYFASLAWESPESAESGDTPNGDRLRKQLAEALRSDELTVGVLGDLLGDVSEAYGDAARKRASKASGRPTRRPRR